VSLLNTFAASFIPLQALTAMPWLSYFADYASLQARLVEQHYCAVIGDINGVLSDGIDLFMFLLNALVKLKRCISQCIDDIDSFIRAHLR
jgi:hypothetical protein